MIARTGRPMYPRIIGGAPEGLTGTLTLAVELPDNTVVQAPSALNIVESGPGAYTATRTAPATAGTYVLVWYDPVDDMAVTEELLVTASSLPAIGAYYATPDDVRSYLDITEDQLSDDVIARPLRMAHKDIDAACGGWDVYEDTGLKFASDDEDAGLTVNQETHLREATCTQVEYRMTVGDDFMIREQHESVSGPGYSTSGSLKKVCGAAYTELSKGGFLRLLGKASNRGHLRLGDLPRAN